MTAVAVRPEYQTLPAMIFHGADRFASRPVALRTRRGGEWVSYSYGDVLEQVEALTAQLRAWGIAPGDRIAILSENRPEWLVTDFACLCARAADVPVYGTLPPRQLEYILRDAGARVVFVSDATQLAKLREVRARLPALEHVVVFERSAADHWAQGFGELLVRGRALRAEYPDWRTYALAAAPDDVATIIYTSGTTGDPKGVMLTHANLGSNVEAALGVLEPRADDECLSFLPLSHIFERMAGHYLMWAAGVRITYAQSIDTVAADMMEARPTIMFSVPRLYEKIYGRVLEGATGGGSLKRAIFRWARGVGERWADEVLAARPVAPPLAMAKRVADALVFGKLRARTGGRLRFFVSGGAPLNPEINRFFFAAGLPILEGYGLTETSPVICVNRPGRIRIGTVGPPLPGVEVRIAADGEILTRGPNVMRGYWNKPEATAEVLDAEGWFRTGDIGELDADGFLRITDRKKDIIVTAGGKNIAPQPIENMAKTCAFVLNAVLLGDRRKFPLMLLVPNLDRLRGWAHHKALVFVDDASLLALPEAQAKMEREVKAVLRDLAQFEMPKKFVLLEHDFSIEAGELTPSLKVRRRIVEERYRGRIEEAYQGG